jgi:hypothetical protein
MTISEEGVDKLIHTFSDTGQLDQEKGQANLYTINVEANNIDSSRLDNSSIRFAIKGEDKWQPEHIIVWGKTSQFLPERTVVLALETDITRTLSNNANEGVPSLPVRLVQTGDRTMEIKRLLILMTTGGERGETHFWAHGYNTIPGTDSPIVLQIQREGSLVVDFEFPESPQEDQEPGQANMYFASTPAQFTKADLSDATIALEIKGTDGWLPDSFFLFGLDDREGRPESLVPLVHLSSWPFGFMSTDSSEGVSIVILPLLTEPFILGGGTILEPPG